MARLYTRASSFKPLAFISETYLFPRIQAQYLPTELSELIDRDLVEYKKQKEAEQEELLKKTEEEDGTVTVTTVTTTTTTTKTVTKKNAQDSTPAAEDNDSLPVAEQIPNAPNAQVVDACLIDPGHTRYRAFSPPPQIPMPPMLRSASPPLPPPVPVNNPVANQIDISEDENLVYLGLRVYTNKESPTKISSKLRHEMDYSDERRMSRSPLRRPRRSSRSPSPWR